MISPGESCVYIDNCVYCSGQHSMQILTQIPAAAAVTTRPASCCPHRGKVVRLPRQLHPARGEQSISHSGQLNIVRLNTSYLVSCRTSGQFWSEFLLSAVTFLAAGSLTDWSPNCQLALRRTGEQQRRHFLVPLPAPARPALSLVCLHSVSYYQTNPKLYDSRWQCSG